MELQKPTTIDDCEGQVSQVGDILDEIEEKLADGDIDEAITMLGEQIQNLQQIRETLEELK